ncbi:hypothetical protein Tco_0380697, partial [Tanacetum coccineum]
TVCLRWVPTGKIFTSSTTKVDSEPPNITNQCESEQALDVSAGTLLSTSTSFNPIKFYKGMTQSLVAEKIDISENKASRNFDLMIKKWCLLKITLQAPFLNVQKAFDRSRSSLGLHGDDV